MKEEFGALIDYLVEGGCFLGQAVEVIEKGMIERTLVITKNNQLAAAKLLGIHRNTLQRKMVEYAIDGKRRRRQTVARKPVTRAQSKTVVRKRKAS